MSKYLPVTCKRKQAAKYAFTQTNKISKHKKFSGFCASKRIAKDGVNYTFPETWGGQLANSNETWHDSGENIVIGIYF